MLFLLSLVYVEHYTSHRPHRGLDLTAANAPRSSSARSTRCSAQRAGGSSSPQSGARMPTRSANDGWGRFGLNAWIGPRSLADDTLSVPSGPTSITATRRG